MSDDEYDNDSDAGSDDNADVGGSDDYDSGDGDSDDSGGSGGENPKQKGGDGDNDDEDDDDDDEDDDDDDDDDETTARKQREKENKELNEDAQHEYDECSAEQSMAMAEAEAETIDYSSYFQSNIMSVNDKERDLKSQHVTFKEATLRPAIIRRTLPILTKYEKAKIIGVRAQQISMGSPAYLSEEDVRKCGGGSNILALAQEELRQKRTPLIVRRILDSKMCLLYEDWYIDDLIDPFEQAV